MPEFLAGPFVASATSPVDVLVRLTMAAVLGAVVAWIYRRTRVGNDFTASFPPTLVLLAILIAMVTQVIGDSVARAFSLVGALSIVRFRTVVRDTQDTAFVIFAVVVGMATGASDPRVAVIGIVIVGLAAFLMRTKPSADLVIDAPFKLNVRVGTGQDLDATIGPVIAGYVTKRRLLSIGTARQGIAIEAAYEVRFRKDKAADELVKALNRLEGVQSVSLEARESAENGL